MRETIRIVVSGGSLLLPYAGKVGMTIFCLVGGGMVIIGVANSLLEWVNLVM